MEPTLCVLETRFLPLRSRRLYPSYVVDDLAATTQQSVRAGGAHTTINMRLRRSGKGWIWRSFPRNSSRNYCPRLIQSHAKGPGNITQYTPHDDCTTCWISETSIGGGHMGFECALHLQKSHHQVSRTISDHFLEDYWPGHFGYSVFVRNLSSIGEGIPLPIGARPNQE
ncbi:uncharacterized protein EI97DRAFT_35907 [Westerdykella ornata]|uniref:Uncharacterized protein n=1 Tax=Westerdykella ornata TaxID=318751 RepID=A0A6A6JJ93_WESOR|nr:uncharacterized protein EI97DRAFT_35907 [Westerdykella ornata]KAF2276334.1 hypothetical protein EI97DRAFT_35907 [Westerdykella ornata]